MGQDTETKRGSSRKQENAKSQLRAESGRTRAGFVPNKREVVRGLRGGATMSVEKVEKVEDGCSRGGQGEVGGSDKRREVDKLGYVGARRLKQLSNVGGAALKGKKWEGLKGHGTGILWAYFG